MYLYSIAQQFQLSAQKNGSTWTPKDVWNFQSALFMAAPNLKQSKYLTIKWVNKWWHDTEHSNENKRITVSTVAWIRDTHIWYYEKDDRNKGIEKIPCDSSYIKLSKLNLQY